MGIDGSYELKGLEEDKSWELFRSLAFKAGQEEGNPNLSSIGKEIVRKCVNVPLAIRTIARILYSRDTEEEWWHFRDTNIRMLEHKDDTIMATLRLSYDHLTPELKQCFAYCSLFPKDDKLDKKRLIWLWMAQGFVKPLDQSQCLEDAAHMYFMELLRRSFFQDVERDCYGDIVKCKMHDLACKVGDECHFFDGSTKYAQWDSSIIRHVSVYNVKSQCQELSSCLLGSKQVRSLIFIGRYDGPAIAKHIWPAMKFLHSLDLDRMVLPNSIGELKHLKYLRTWVGSALPDGITMLHQLQTLVLQSETFASPSEVELPRQFNKLTNLRCLNCHTYRLKDMPLGFGELKLLVELDHFIVGENNGTDALGSMNLGGGLHVCFRKWRPNVVSESMATNLRDKKLTSLSLNWSKLVNEEESSKEADEVLKWLQPPTTLKELNVFRWKGEEFPRWGVDGVPCLLPNLVRVHIYGCYCCRHLPTFGRLPNLKHLILRGLGALEYIEGEGSDSCNSNSEGVGSSSSAALTRYFPCLQELELFNMKEVKGWWGRESEIMISTSDLHHSFSCLKKLIIWWCPKLKTIALPVWEYRHLSRLEVLRLEVCGELDLLKEVTHSDDTTFISSSSSSSAWCCLRNLRVLSLDNMSKIERVPEGISCLTHLGAEK